MCGFHDSPPSCGSLFQILLCFIWLRRYPSMHHLAFHFGISVSLVHRIIHKMIPHLHSWAVPKYIRWHSMAYWRRLAGTFPEWPNVVAILDCTPFRINKPTGTVTKFLSMQVVHRTLFSNFSK